MTLKKIKFIQHNKTLATWLLTAREKLQLSQGKAAADMGFTQTFLSGIERGAAKIISVDRWQRLYAYYLEKGATPLGDDKDPMKNLPDVAAMRKQIKEMRETTKSSLKDISWVLGVGESTLSNFLRGEGMKTDGIYAVHAGLQKLKAKPEELVKEDLLEVTKAKKQKAPKATKRSLIETVPAVTNMPSLMELDMRELEIIQRMRGHLLQQPPANPKLLNGRRH